MTTKLDRFLLSHRALNIAGVLGVILLVVAFVGELFGWWRDLGIALGLFGVVLTIWYGVGTATERTVTRLEEPILMMADRLTTIEVVLEREIPAMLATLLRIETLLETRLPPPRPNPGDDR